MSFLDLPEQLERYLMPMLYRLISAKIVYLYRLPSYSRQAPEPQPASIVGVEEQKPISQGSQSSDGEIKMLNLEDRWLSMNDICQYLGVCNDTVYKWIDKQNMPAHRMGRLWKFKKDEVDEWIKAGGATDQIDESPCPQ